MARDEVFKTWNSLWGSSKPNFIPIDSKHDTISLLLNTILDNVSTPYMTFLDVGCGPGSRTVPIVGSRDDVHLILLDQSAEALELAREHALYQQVPAQYKQADGFKLPFEDGSLNCVFANGVNEHFEVPERQELINEMARVVKPEGQLALIVPNKLNPFHTANKKISEKRGTWKFGPQFDFTPKELKNRMQDAGLVDIQSFGVGAYTSWIRMLPRERQKKHYQSPTRISGVNEMLWRGDANTSSRINRTFGREILVIGRKTPQ